MTATHKRLRSLIVTGGMMVVALGINVVPAGAHTNTHPDTAYNQGHGEFTATSAPMPPACSWYSNYVANLAFDHGAVSGATATVKSASDPTDPNYLWGEFWDGTYNDLSCDQGTAADDHGNGGDPIGGFTGTLKTAGGSLCTLGDGTYTRGHLGTTHPELNIMYEFGTVSGGGDCPSAPLRLKATILHTHPDPGSSDYVTVCSSPIAPQNCELDHQEHPSEW